MLRHILFFTTVALLTTADVKASQENFHNASKGNAKSYFAPTVKKLIEAVQARPGSEDDSLTLLRLMDGRGIEASKNDGLEMKGIRDSGPTAEEIPLMQEAIYKLAMGPLDTAALKAQYHLSLDAIGSALKKDHAHILYYMIMKVRDDMGLDEEHTGITAVLGRAGFVTSPWFLQNKHVFDAFARKFYEQDDRFTPLPDEVKLHIFENLNARDLAGSVNRVSKDFYNLAEDDNLWRTECFENGIKKAETDTSWKQAYKANIKLPAILRDLRLALSKNSLITSSHTSYAVPKILEKINKGDSPHDVYDYVSGLKMIQEPGASEGTVTNTRFMHGGKISCIHLYNTLIANHILKEKDVLKINEEDLILTAAKYGIPVLWTGRKDANGGDVLNAIDPSDPALLAIKAHREYEDAVRNFIRAYEEQAQGK